jgi:hypothetical protein
VVGGPRHVRKSSTSQRPQKRTLGERVLAVSTHHLECLVVGEEKSGRKTLQEEDEGKSACVSTRVKLIGQYDTLDLSGVLLVLASSSSQRLNRLSVLLSLRIH